MLIQDAIKEAGPGGKFNVPDGCIWTAPKGEYGYITDMDGTPVVVKPNDLTRTDWQVVAEERIEAGDVVIPKNGHTEHRVIHVNDGNVWIVRPDGKCYQSSFRGLTLIRKGPAKHVFKGMGAAVISCLENACVVTGGVKYKLTLEEMDDVS